MCLRLGVDPPRYCRPQVLGTSFFHSSPLISGKWLGWLRVCSGRRRAERVRQQRVPGPRGSWRFSATPSWCLEASLRAKTRQVLRSDPWAAGEAPPLSNMAAFWLNFSGVAQRAVDEDEKWPLFQLTPRHVVFTRDFEGPCSPQGMSNVWKSRLARL